MATIQQRHQPLIEVLYVHGCPHAAETVALVEGVRAELGIQAELRLRLIGDQAAAERVRFRGSPTILVDGRDVEPEPSHPTTPSWRAACTATSTLWSASQPSAGSAMRCWRRPAAPVPRQPTAARHHGPAR